MVKCHYYDPQSWLKHVAQIRGEKEAEFLQTAFNVYGDTVTAGPTQATGIADILLNLGADDTALAVALLYPALQLSHISRDSIKNYLDENGNKLLQDVLHIQSLNKIQTAEQRNSAHVENVRKMLLAMVCDVRAVLVVLAERLWQLRHAKDRGLLEQERLARETLDIYAPLANRLGVWQLKWELEDLCLRYLQPDVYTKIAKYLANRREVREAYIQRATTFVNGLLRKSGIHDFQVSGRVKHIYSIYRKMLRKGADFNEIYDISALRVLVSTVQDCYNVLGILQDHWPQVPGHFNDYISQPKPNGYRSIHAVMQGPENVSIEVQVRTYQMHQESELGIAAHWRYKEQTSQATEYEHKIALLRQIMAWQNEVQSSGQAHSKHPMPDLFADRVYVFTPKGDIIDLPNGSTPLDFAYAIHSQVGHRCRGAKVNGKIMSLTYQLQTGEQIEVLTTKEASPSRDWLNPQLGYLKTANARAKARQWFRAQDNLKNSRELLTEKEAATARPLAPLIVHPKKKDALSKVSISGIDNVLTQPARCCQPLPGDHIVGHITRNRGVMIHRKDCKNLVHLDAHPERLFEATWNETLPKIYPVSLHVQAYARPGLLRDMTTLLANEKINLVGIQARESPYREEANISITIEIENIGALQKTVSLLMQIPNVFHVGRS